MYIYIYIFSAGSSWKTSSFATPTMNSFFENTMSITLHRRGSLLFCYCCLFTYACSVSFMSVDSSCLFNDYIFPADEPAFLPRGQGSSALDPVSGRAYSALARLHGPCVPASEKRDASRQEDRWEDELSEHRIKGSRENIVFAQELGGITCLTLTSGGMGGVQH